MVFSMLSFLFFLLLFCITIHQLYGFLHLHQRQSIPSMCIHYYISLSLKYTDKMLMFTFPIPFLYLQLHCRNVNTSLEQFSTRQQMILRTRKKPVKSVVTSLRVFHELLRQSRCHSRTLCSWTQAVRMLTWGSVVVENRYSWAALLHRKNALTLEHVHSA